MKVKKTEGENGFTVFTIEPGRTVICDWGCGEDYTDRPDEGGILLGSKAICPKCAKEALPSIERYNETHLIRDRCPGGMSFADWIRSMR